MDRLSQLGVVLIALGVVTIVAPSGAFEAVTSDRGVAVETASDERDALLGLEEEYDESDTILYDEGGLFTDPTSEPATVATVTNNVGEEWSSVDVEVESVVWNGRTDSRVLDVSGAPGALTAGESGQIELACSQDVSGTADDAAVGLDIEGDGESTTIQRDSFTVSDVSFDCEGADSPGTAPPDDPVPIGDIEELEVVGTPTANERVGWGQQPSWVQFELQNTGDGQVSATEVQISETTADATRVEDITGSGPEIEIGSDGVLDAENGLSIGAVSYPLNTAGTINQDETSTVNIEQFRSGGLFDQTDMTGESVTVVLVVEGLDPNDPESEVPVEIELENLEGS